MNDRPVLPWAVLFAMSLVLCIGCVSTTGSNLDSAAFAITSSSQDYCSVVFDQTDGDEHRESSVEAVEDGVSRSLDETGFRLARSAADLSACRRLFENGNVAQQTLFRSLYRQFQQNTSYEFSTDDAVAAVQSEISSLWILDQASRMTYSAFNSAEQTELNRWSAQLAAVRAHDVDTQSLATMKRVVADYGWVDSHRFGDDISEQAWTLVQHADRDPAFQQQVLLIMEKYLDSGGLKNRHYAYLWDRVAVNHGQRQRYGTQPVWECHEDGLRLQPMQYPGTVNERRSAFGMNTVEEQLAEMSRSFCGTR